MNSIARMESVVMKKLSYNLNVTRVGQLINKGNISSELENWSPKDAVPRGPRNAGGVTEKFWDNWEHGVDGDQFLDLYRQYAGEMLGLPVPKSDKVVGGSGHYLTLPGFGGSSTNTVRKQTEAVLNAIANGRPQPTL